MTAKFFAILTNQGAAKLANATALGTRLDLTQLAVGDGGGTLPTPDSAQTKLKGEKRRAAINMLSIDPANPNQIIAEQVIPETEGGWWIREIGLFDKDGVLIAVANCPETYKPQLQEGSGRTQTIRMVLIVSSIEAVTLKIDPSVVLATRDYVDNAITAHAKSRNHPDASLTNKGLVQLSSATNSDSETLAATPKAVKTAYDMAAKAYTKEQISALNFSPTAAVANAVWRRVGKVTNLGQGGQTIVITMGGTASYNGHPNANGLTQIVIRTGSGSITAVNTVGRASVSAFVTNGMGFISSTQLISDLGLIETAVNTFEFYVKFNPFVSGISASISSTSIAHIIDNWTWDKTEVTEPVINLEREIVKVWTEGSLVNPLKAGDYGVGTSSSVVVFNADEVGVNQFCRYPSNATGSPGAAPWAGIQGGYDGASRWEMVWVMGSTSVNMQTRCRSATGVWGGWCNILHSSNTTTDANGFLKSSSASTEAALIRADSPIGIPQPWPTNTAPSGWLKCNGATFDKAKYPLLAVAYPSGTLPDLRGEFIRGWDDGRGVDAGRGVLSAQQSSKISGQLFGNNTTGYGNGWYSDSDVSYDGWEQAGFVPMTSPKWGFLGSSTPPVGATGVVRNTGYIRPRNIAFNYIVRAA